VFKWRLVEVPFSLALPYWIEDPDFDLDFHIRESAVPPPGNDDRLAEVVARIFARPLDRRRPLWELYLIHGLEGGRVALLTKIHHSAVDGVSGNELLSILLDPSPEGREIPPAPPDSGGERAPGELEMLGRGVLGLPNQPLRALRSVPAALPNLVDLPGANTFPGVPGTGLRRGSGRARGDHRAGAHHVLQRQDLAPPPPGHRAALARHRQGDQERRLHHRERRGGGPVRLGPAGVADRARRAAR
jgi:hypothetical protein